MKAAQTDPQHEILNHIRKARRKVECLPAWKQDVLASGLPEAQKHLTNQYHQTEETMSSRATHPLWPGGHVIKCLGVTGEHGVGKTLFLLSIASPDRTLIYDKEMSSSDCNNFVERGLTRIDVNKELLTKFPNGYTSKGLFIWWLNHMRSIEPNRYEVIAIDPANEFESGLTEWVADRYREFGFSSATAFKNMGGVFHGTVKDEWDRILSEVCFKCDTFAFANHMRNVWIKGEPTDEREAKGKETFHKLSSIYLQLEKEPEDLAPSAIVLKSRLQEAEFDETTGRVKRIIQVLRRGQRIPIATPEALRGYMEAPVGDRELLPEEVAKTEEVTEYDVLQLKAAIAREERQAAELRREESDKEESRAEARKAAKERMRGKKTEKAVKPPEVLADLRKLLDDAEEAGVKERLIKGLQMQLGFEATGELMQNEAEKVTAEIIAKFRDGLNNLHKDTE